MMSKNTVTTTNHKDAKIDSIPADWRISRLKDIVEFSKKPRTLDLSRFEDVPFIPMEQISDDGITIAGYVPKVPTEISSGSYCEKGDILLAKITPSFENGKQAIVENIPLDFAYATTEVYAFKPIAEKLDRMFLFHYFRLPSVRIEIAGQMEGTTGRQRIPKTVIEQCSVPLPPLPEQRRIAAVLNAIQEAIVAQEDVITAARAFKRSLMQRLFTYGPGREPAETRETEIGEIPVHWQTAVLRNLVRKKITDGTHKTPIYQENGIPFISATNLKNNRVDFSACKFISQEEHKLLTRRCRPEPGDILLSKVGTLGLVAEVESEPEFSVFVQVALIKPSDAVESRYLMHCLASESMQHQIVNRASQSTMMYIGVGKIAELEIPLPPPSERLEIAIMLDACDAKIAAEEDRKVALQAFFKSTLHQLMTGQTRLLHDEGLPL